MPFGPKVLFTKSPMAMAPIKDDLKEKNQKRQSRLTNDKTREVQFCHLQEAGRAYQARGLGSLFISSSLEDIHRCEGKGGLEGETETLRFNACTL